VNIEKANLLFFKIVDEMVDEHDSVNLGKMMSSPALRYKSRIFAFYYNNEMIFRLGKEFNLETFRLREYSILNPFKNKAPMYD